MPCPARLCDGIAWRTSRLVSGARDCGCDRRVSINHWYANRRITLALTRRVSEARTSLTRKLHQLDCAVCSTAFRRNGTFPAKAGTTNGLRVFMQFPITQRVNMISLSEIRHLLTNHQPS